MYKLKIIARRSTLLGAASALAFAAVLPAALASAQALNPLTERSLLLSSSAPGFVDTDGSNYSTANPNPGGDTVLTTPRTGIANTYAPAGSGPNGKKTGQTFSFRASTSATVQAFTFQYCTTAAGWCQAPGNNDGDARNNDRQLNEDSESELSDGGWSNSKSDLNVTPGFAQAASGIAAAGGEFQISVGNSAGSKAVTTVDDWEFATTNDEDDDYVHDTNARLTGKNNFITLSSETGIDIGAGDYIEVKFVANENVHITNPGHGHFFVKINTYSDEAAATIVDGGVTVANVMTDSIHITTKVLETMAFSVGTQNPDKVAGGPHGTCDAINQINNNRLNLGNPSAEFSLETGRAWDVYSYWRLSSNSSGGASVYYSGNTLANTVGDEIAAMTTKEASLPGTEQFGLGFVDAQLMTNDPANNTLEAWSPGFTNLVAENDRYRLPTSFPFVTLGSQAVGSGEFTGLSVAQDTGADYRDATGSIYATDGDDNIVPGAGTAEFKFLPSSLFIPEPIAQQNESVISCATAKMRYVGNIAADTPAGVYTTKVNYLAAPQY